MEETTAYGYMRDNPVSSTVKLTFRSPLEIGIIAQSSRVPSVFYFNR